jgi:hypothetical protein
MEESQKGKFVATDKNLTTIKKAVGFVGREDKTVGIVKQSNRGST